MPTECSVSVVFIHTMEDGQRLNTLVHEGDTLHFSIVRRQTVTTLVATKPDVKACSCVVVSSSVV